ncbi:LOW QUALITY PROTEIN: alpha-(1,3)-fucosyltransferase 11-like [Xenia sp. Carnegie-2017]|uniref:LOW QUALITY PROTEIN: alpha-(1,3)-fucosyltransferase 11-like n=1 Tax=Xenia sp. Carnegie-2017 TaxID=2897299 RepID=UPI001F032F84|nr:LOW QUALITY PROTEIN: alpha-(1,3)-fucosyltransferase 11-like [Xenia sp. Carnegie-2017]
MVGRPSARITLQAERGAGVWSTLDPVLSSNRVLRMRIAAAVNDVATVRLKVNDVEKTTFEVRKPRRLVSAFTVFNPALEIDAGGIIGFSSTSSTLGDKEGECPVACEVTSDHKRAKEANGFIVHSRDPYPLPPSKDVPWILTGMENPVYTPILSDGNFMSQFQLSRSYRLDSDFPTPLFTKPNLDPPVPFRKKTGGIIATLSNCEAVRTAYIRHLMEHVHVDSYGGCLHNKDGIVGRWAPNFREAKQDVEKLYKFVIVFFNQDCDYYVDEKILNALNAGAVPVVMSTDKINDFLPGNLKNAIINVREFKSPKQLAERLKFLMNNKTEYNKFLEWKVKGLGHINDTVIGRFWESKFRQWCYVCQGVSDGKGHKEGLKPDFCKTREYEDWGITP